MLINKLHKNMNMFYELNYRSLRLTNPLFIFKGSELTWANRQANPGIEDYELMYKWVIENNQHSLTITDQGIFQIYYDTNENEIIKANLSFLPNPELSHQYIRFDYDPSAKISFDHSIGHFHFGYPSDYMRICLSAFPFPSEFMKFVFTILGILENNFDTEKFLTIDQTVDLNHILTFKCE